MTFFEVLMEICMSRNLDFMPAELMGFVIEF